MSENSSKSHTSKQPEFMPEQQKQDLPRKKSTKVQWKAFFGLPLWVVFGFAVAQVLVVAVVYLLRLMGVDFSAVNQTVLNTCLAAIIYVLTIGIVVGVPVALKRAKLDQNELGLSRLPRWMDILLAPVGFVVYLIGSGILVYLATQFLPSFDVNQSQNVGFENISGQVELLLAFVTLVVIAPVAEEVLFRGYLYGKLRKTAPIWLAIILTSAVFGLVHGQVNVGLDVFALSVVMCVLREATGSIWAGILLHMMKNGIAFYLLFVNPALLHTIGG